MKPISTQPPRIQDKTLNWPDRLSPGLCQIKATEHGKIFFSGIIPAFVRSPEGCTSLKNLPGLKAALAKVPHGQADTTAIPTMNPSACMMASDKTLAATLHQGFISLAENPEDHAARAIRVALDNSEGCDCLQPSHILQEIINLCCALRAVTGKHSLSGNRNNVTGLGFLCGDIAVEGNFLCLSIDCKLAALRPADLFELMKENSFLHALRIAPSLFDVWIYLPETVSRYAYKLADFLERVYALIYASMIRRAVIGIVKERLPHAPLLLMKNTYNVTDTPSHYNFTAGNAPASTHPTDGIAWAAPIPLRLPYFMNSHHAASAHAAFMTSNDLSTTALQTIFQSPELRNVQMVSSESSPSASVAIIPLKNIHDFMYETANYISLFLEPSLLLETLLDVSIDNIPSFSEYLRDKQLSMEDINNYLPQIFQVRVPSHFFVAVPPPGKKLLITFMPSGNEYVISGPILRKIHRDRTVLSILDARPEETLLETSAQGEPSLIARAGEAAQYLIGIAVCAAICDERGFIH